jgi:hypothetical protein
MDDVVPQRIVGSPRHQWFSRNLCRHNWIENLDGHHHHELQSHASSCYYWGTLQVGIVHGLFVK